MQIYFTLLSSVLMLCLLSICSNSAHCSAVGNFWPIELGLHAFRGNEEEGVSFASKCLPKHKLLISFKLFYGFITKSISMVSCSQDVLVFNTRLKLNFV